MGVTCGVVLCVGVQLVALLHRHQSVALCACVRACMLSSCVCVCVCVRARVCVCVRVPDVLTQWPHVLTQRLGRRTTPVCDSEEVLPSRIQGLSSVHVRVCARARVLA